MLSHKASPNKYKKIVIMQYIFFPTNMQLIYKSVIERKLEKKNLNMWKLKRTLLVNGSN